MEEKNYLPLREFGPKILPFRNSFNEILEG